MKDLAEFVAIVVGLGLLFSWLGVYGTGDTPFHERFLFWAVTMAIGGGSGLILARWVWEPNTTWPAWLKIGVLAAIVSVPVTLVIYAFSGFSVSPIYLVYQYGYVLVVAAVITTGMYVWDAWQKQAESGEPDVDRTADFLARLPVKFRTADLYAIVSEDHYLRVYTSLGDELILMRLADAARELSGTAGARVHRSWWVAKAAIVDEKRENGRRLLVLKNGAEVPVSRSFQPAAREAGLIA